MLYQNGYREEVSYDYKYCYSLTVASLFMINNYYIDYIIHNAVLFSNVLHLLVTKIHLESDIVD